MAEPPPSMSTSLQLNNIPKGGYKVTITAANGARVFYQKIKHPSQITLNPIAEPGTSIDEIPPTTFPNFNLLPPELRAMIWGVSLNQPRIFWPTDESGEMGELQGVSFAHKPPAVRQVCREARKVSDRRGAFLFGIAGSHLTSLWFDFHSDILFDWDSCLRREAFNSKLTDHVRNIALMDSDARQLQRVEDLQQLLRRYPKCQKIIFVWTGVLMDQYGDIKFYPIYDDEPVEKKGSNGNSSSNEN